MRRDRAGRSKEAVESSEPSPTYVDGRLSPASGLRRRRLSSHSVRTHGGGRPGIARRAAWCPDRTSGLRQHWFYAVCPSGHRSCSQHPLRYSASTASFFVHVLLAGARQRSRSALPAQSAAVLDGARATSPRGPRLHGQRRRADCAASTSARQAIASSSCGARIRMRKSCALAHGRARATQKCDSTSDTWLDSLGTRQCQIAHQAGRAQTASHRDRNRARSRAQPSKQRLVGAMLAGVPRDKKTVSKKKKHMFAARGRA